MNDLVLDDAEEGVIVAPEPRQQRITVLDLAGCPIYRFSYPLGWSWSISLEAIARETGVFPARVDVTEA